MQKFHHKCHIYISCTTVIKSFTYVTRKLEACEIIRSKAGLKGQHSCYKISVWLVKGSYINYKKILPLNVIRCMLSAHAFLWK